MNQDNSHSWVRISYGTVKYVIGSIQDNTEIPADPQEEQVPQTSTSVVAARSKAKAKPQPRGLVGTTATIPIHERRWIDIEPSNKILPRTISRGKPLIFFDTIKRYSEKKMEQLNSTR